MKKAAPGFGKLSFLCCFAFFMYFFGRFNYTAALTEIIRDLAVSRQVASIAVTGNFITLLIGQIVAGVLGDRIRPRHLVTMGLVVSGIINLVMGFLPNIWWMTALWTVNGFFQAFLWPPLVRVMAENMDAGQYAKAALAVSVSSSAGSLLIYLLVPLAIVAAGWRLSFWGAGAVGLFVGAVWMIGTAGVKEGSPRRREQTSDDHPVSLGRVIRLSGLVPLFFAMIALGALRDGVTTWMPTYIYDQYKLSSSFSIFTSTLLPVFGMAGIMLAGRMEKRFRNLTKSSTILFVVTAAAIAVMLPFYNKNLILCVLLISVVVGCAYGLTHLLTGQLPGVYSKYGCVARISGLTTAAFYIGSTLSTYGYAALSDNFGWFVTIISWLMLAGLGIFTCAVSIRRWFKFEHGDRKND